MKPLPEVYKQAAIIADALEAELRRIGRWAPTSPPPEAFEKMGALGAPTISFEAWIQFVLLERIRDIVRTDGEFPDVSETGVYAVRYFDGDPEPHDLVELLSDLDTLIESDAATIYNPQIRGNTIGKNVEIGGELPEVAVSLAEVLHLSTPEQLESNLQSFDSFLEWTNKDARLKVVGLLQAAAEKSADPVVKAGIQKAANSVAQGGRAAQPYNHEESMRRYRDEFKKGYE